MGRGRCPRWFGCLDFVDLSFSPRSVCTTTARGEPACTANLPVSEHATCQLTCISEFQRCHATCQLTCIFEFQRRDIWTGAASAASVDSTATQAGAQVVLRNRFIARAGAFAAARRRGRTVAASTDKVLGYMITNFNALSCESSSALEMLLDWFHSYTSVAAQPALLLDRLVERALACCLYECMANHSSTIC